MLVLGLLGVVAGALITGCGGENTSAVKSVVSATRSALTTTAAAPTTTDVAVPATTDESAPFPVTVTVIETIPSEAVTVTAPPQIVTVTSPTETVLTTTPAQTVTVTSPGETTTVTETANVSNPGAAAAAGAAVATSQSESSDGLTSEDWGWIAFGVLLLLVIATGVVWLVRRRATGPEPVDR